MSTLQPIFDIPTDQNLRKRVQDTLQKNAQDLRCGDVFLFNNKLYICLTNKTDLRTTLTTIVAIAQEDASIPLRTITTINYFRTIRVHVLHHMDMIIKREEVPSSAVSDDDIARLEAIRAQQPT